MQKELQRANDKALFLLGLRDHSSLELYKKLCRTFEKEIAAQTVAHMQEIELCDDEKFARHRVKYLRNKNKSQREIKMNLSQLGIDKVIIEDVLYEDQTSDDSAACLVLVEKKYARKIREGQSEKVAAALARRGFAYRDIKNALNVFNEELAENEF